MDLASNAGIVSKSGAWYAYNEEKIGQGRENAKQYLIEHRDIFDEIYNKVRVHYNIGGKAEKELEEESSKVTKTADKSDK